MYLGVSTLNLDAKGRLAIPARYRETLAGECASRVVLTINPSKTDRCLLLFPENEWLSVARKLAGLPFTDEKGQALKRLLLGHAAELELDAQGPAVLTGAPSVQHAGHGGFGVNPAVSRQTE